VAPLIRVDMVGGDVRPVKAGPGSPIECVVDVGARDLCGRGRPADRLLYAPTTTFDGPSAARLPPGSPTWSLWKFVTRIAVGFPARRRLISASTPVTLAAILAASAWVQEIKSPYFWLLCFGRRVRNSGGLVFVDESAEEITAA
jgi:hypothetical protein